MDRRIINLGILRQGSQADHAEDMGAIVESASQTCNCIRLSFAGTEIEFTLQVPHISAEVFAAYDSEFIANGVPMERRIKGTLWGRVPYELIIRFAVYG